MSRCQREHSGCDIEAGNSTYDWKNGCWHKTHLDLPELLNQVSKQDWWNCTVSNSEPTRSETWVWLDFGICKFWLDIIGMITSWSSAAKCVSSPCCGTWGRSWRADAWSWGVGCSNRSGTARHLQTLFPRCTSRARQRPLLSRLAWRASVLFAAPTYITLRDKEFP